ncbi:cyclopropane fatty acyl phospholipid synthase [Gynuella sunshinyii]|uniref:Cyclopropane fatty acid synthase and related methyltransferase n=1 Tax=Gynuella sunshinyii YC6258 TaxID=1445510 RepID=A0A0C5VFF8_9GAMM|nr:cyclopropane fatty acyl phospholipid synthase [Gynuella sunshinyii]AJQ93262.1 cyclopropane fatty acid synthase and related methyltransferase [Gynuella sunshinyii YC6258]
MTEYSFNDAEKSYSNSAPLPPLARRFQQELLDLADVKLNGDRPWDITVHDNRLFARVARDGSIGLGESYMDGWWDSERLDMLFTQILGAQLNQKLIGTARIKLAFSALSHMMFNFQSLARAYQVGEVHYDIGNQLYERMLDPYMIYSCGYWKGAENLAQAQEHKLDLICRKLQLEPGMHLLDIGCGWGGLALYAAKHYGVKVTGITISREQQKLAAQRTRDYDVEIRLEDYRHLTGKFDRIVSVGMFEHVGRKNYRTYFEVVNRLLKKDGLFLLHTIGEEPTFDAADRFISKYIFPNGKVPSRKHINDHSVDLLRLEDWHNFGPDYDTTLMAWAKNFEQSWPELKQDYNDRFYRMWRYYLYSCAGYFRSREGQLWQLVYSHPQGQRVYHSVR